MDNNSKQLKAFNVKLTVEEVDEINRLRDLREKPRGRKHAISIIDWIVEAVQDKIRKEKQENGLK